MWLLLLSILVPLALFLAYKHGRNRPPGPFGVPILGYLPFVDPRRPYETFARLARRFGPVYGVQLGRVYAVVLADAALVRDTLKLDAAAGRAPLFITHGIMGGRGLICAEGDIWREQRRLCIDWLRAMGMVKFGTNRERLEARILQRVEVALAEFLPEAGPVDPFPPLHHHLGNLMNDLVFGVTYASDSPTWQYLQHLQEEGVKHIGVSGVVNFLPWLRFLPSNRRTIDFLLDGKRKTHVIYDRLIRRAEQEADAYPDCILARFIAERRQRDASDAFSNDQLRHVLADLFGAGVDTTLTTLRWFILYLATNPDAQRRARDEMGETPPTLEDWDKLPFLRACLAETQRIRSVVPLGIPHGTTREIRIGEFVVPAGTMILPLQWAIHMDERRWPEPETFRPGRFLDEEGQFRNIPDFLPFQSGKRICLGEELARMLLFLFAARFVHRFSFELEEEEVDFTGTCGITLTPPRYSLRLKLKELK